MPVTCTPTATLQGCVQMCAESKVHRVWVVDEKRCPLGVVSLTDILRVMVAPEEEIEGKKSDAMEM